MGGEIAVVGVEEHPHLPDPPGHKGGLGRPGHPHGDVGLPAQQILLAIRQHQFDDDVRMAFAEGGDQGRQHLGADDLAGGQPDHPALRRRLAGGRADQGLGGGGHGLGMRLQGQGRLGGGKAAGRAGEQGRPEGVFQGCDVPADGGLGRTQPSGGCGQAAGFHDGKQRSVEGPVRRVGHAEMNIRPSTYRNFV